MANSYSIFLDNQTQKLKMTRKISRIPIAALLALQIIWLESCYSQPVVAPIIREAVSNQESIYQSRGANRPEGYVIDRDLIFYTSTFPAEFDNTLANLGPGDRWLDIGAGRGQAILDYYGEKYDSMRQAQQEQRGKKAQTVAISIEDRRTRLWTETATKLEADKIKYYFGKRLREYTSAELGKFQVITDLLGGFSYTESIHLFMEKVLSLLTLNGSFYTILQDVHSEDGTNQPYYPDARYLTELTDANGAELKVCSWLKRIGCVAVTCQLRADWKPPVEVYRIQKVCDNVTVPALTPTHFESGTPPERRFKISVLPQGTTMTPPQAKTR